MIARRVRTAVRFAALTAAVGAAFLLPHLAVAAVFAAVGL
jgi:hypothetical protein